MSFINVFEVTDPHLLLDEKNNDHLLSRLLPESDRRAPVITVIDASEQTLAGIGDRVPGLTGVIRLGVKDFDRSGSRQKVLARHGIDANSIVQVVREKFKRGDSARSLRSLESAL